MVNQNDTHLKSIGYILWLFGFTGSHRFYYGKPITGTIWFFTLGLLGIGWLIDLFLIPSMDRQADVRFQTGPVNYSVAWILLTFLGLFRVHGLTVPWHKAIRATSAEMFGFIGEQVDGREDVEANGATAFMVNRFDRIQHKWLPQIVRGWTGWAMMWSASMGLYFLSLMIAFVLGAYLFGIGTLTLGSVYLVFQYIEMAHRPIDQIREQLIDLQKAGASIERVEGLFATQTRLDQRDHKYLPNGPLRVTFDDVTFSYDDDAGHETVLDEVSFEGADLPDTRVVIDRNYVQQRLADIAGDQDLSRFIL